MWPRGHELPTDVPARVPYPSWYRGSKEWIAWEEHVRNIEGWHWFLVGFAPATVYPHTVFVDIFVLETEYAEPYAKVERLTEAIKDLMGIR